MSDTTGDASDGAERPVLLATAAMRARRRPLLVVLWWAFEIVLAYALVYPLIAVVRSTYGAHPQGDAPLYRAGGVALVDFVVGSRGVLPALGAHIGVVVTFALVAGLFPLGAFLAGVAYATPDRRAPPLRFVLARAARAFTGLLALLVVMSVLEGFFAGVAFFAGKALSGALSKSLGEASADQIGVTVTLILLVPTALVGVLHDLARAATVRFEVPGMRALPLALNTLRRGVATALWSWGWRGAVAWLPVAMGAVVAHRLGDRGPAALLVIAILHQLVLVTRVALRASWLAQAMRLVDDAHRVLKPAAAPSPP